MKEEVYAKKVWKSFISLDTGICAAMEAAKKLIYDSRGIGGVWTQFGSWKASLYHPD